MRSGERSFPGAASHLTAIARRTPSRPARDLLGLCGGQHWGSVLDYGCGRGTDVEFYRDNGFESEGFDPYGSYGYGQCSIQRFDLVACVYVLNVIASPIERVGVLRESAYLGGDVFVAVRTRGDVASAALRGRWECYGDGWISSAKRNTFQVGLDVDDVAAIAEQALLPGQPLVVSTGAYTGLLFQHI